MSADNEIITEQLITSEVVHLTAEERVKLLKEAGGFKNLPEDIAQRLRDDVLADRLEQNLLDQVELVKKLSEAGCSKEMAIADLLAFSIQLSKKIFGFEATVRACEMQLIGVPTESTDRVVTQATEHLL